MSCLQIIKMPGELSSLEFPACSIENKYDVLEIRSITKRLADAIGLDPEREYQLEAVVTEFTEMVTKPRRTGSISLRLIKEGEKKGIEVLARNNRLGKKRSRAFLERKNALLGKSLLELAAEEKGNNLQFSHSLGKGLEIKVIEWAK